MKTMRISFLLVGALAALGALALAAQDTFSLKRTPKEGEVNKYKFQAALSFNGVAVEISADSTEKVLKVDEQGIYTLEQTQGAVHAKFGDQEQDIAEVGSPVQSKHKPNGEVIEMTGTDVDGNAMRLANLSLFVAPEAPAKVGDKWTHEVAANPKNDNIGGKAEYEIASVEKIGDEDAVVVKFSYKEGSGSNPASSDGKVWLSAKTGVLLKLEAEYKQAPAPQVGQIDMKIVVTKA